MNTNTPMKNVKRISAFLEKDALRLDISGIDSAKEVGGQIGEMIARSFDGGSPVKEAFLYGGCCAGKSSMAGFIVNGFGNSKGCTIRRQTRMQKISQTKPRCIHIDYRLHSGNPLVWKAVPEYGIPRIADDEILIGEWCEFLPESYFLPDRLMLEIISARSIKKALAKTEYHAPSTKTQMAMLEFVNKQPRARVLTLVGFGSGKEVVDGIAEMNRDRIVDPLSGE